MNIHDQNHPMWRFLNFLIVLALVVVASWSNASNFDETELRMITQIMAAMFGIEAFRGFLASKKGGQGGD